MSTFRKVLLTIGLLITAGAAFAQGTLKGTITDQKTGEPMWGVNVLAKQNDQVVGGGQTDMDGIYTIKALPVGKYDLEVSFVGYKKHVRKGVEVRSSDFTVVNINLEPTAEMLEAVEIVEEKVPLIEVGSAAVGARLSGDDIAKMPGTSVESIVAAVGGVGYNDGGTGTARGEDGMVTMQGGVRKRTGVNVPKEAIAEIQVILGGTPASIGESVGGAQIITLKPPSSQFFGVVKLTSYLDYRLSNNLTMWLTGPVVKKKTVNDDGSSTERTLIGFRFTGVGRYTKWPSYRAKDGRYMVVNDDKVMELEQSPILYDPIANAVHYAGEYLHRSDFVEITRPNARNYFSSKRDKSTLPNFASYSIVTEGALDIRFSDYATMTITGEFDYAKSPNTSILPLNMISAASGTNVTKNASIQVDFTQRFPDEAKSTDETMPATKSSVSNIMYTIQGLYNRYSVDNYNEAFGDNVFKYGHVGTFRTNVSRSYAMQQNFTNQGVVYPTAMVQDSWNYYVDMSEYQPSEYNPVLSNYNTQLMGIANISPYLTSRENIRAFDGLLNGDDLPSINSLINSVGYQYSTFSKQVNNYYYLNAKASANIGKHEIEIGFQFDKYNTSYYGLNARKLWTVMYNSANAHISQLDYNNPRFTVSGNGTLQVDYDRFYNGDAQSYFDMRLRQALADNGMLNDDGELFTGIRDVTWVDVDRYDPDFYMNNGGLDMFSATELLNSGNPYVSYYGYDHTGKKYSSRGWNLNKFFDPISNGENGKYMYLPAFSPTYMAGYIQDKFFFEDLIFNVGVRVDYFDGNQMVLKDPYLLYDSYTIGKLRSSLSSSTPISFNTGLGDGSQFPGGAEDSWVVYVDDPSAYVPTVRGYRDGTTWYNAEGIQLASPSSIVGESGKPTPFRTAQAQNIYMNGNSSQNKISADAFEDYKPQVVVMPRLAFSFPVAEKAQFKANYDIIARRPSSAWQADYISYLFMTQINSVSNPNLKPERNTNYEVGFQQVLPGDRSAISISAYYKETRDLIQLVQYDGADPNSSYFSYDNMDFKTTKGFTFSYDLRQTKNIRINANYTLQYAEGTGLTSTTMTELIREGYSSLKMLNPIADDRRHEFKANIDFRYESGAKYNGPSWKRTVKDKETGELKAKEVRPLENFGVNLMAYAQSGRPYTRALSSLEQTIVGGYRGARLPWGFYFDVALDKTWPIEFRNKDGQLKRMTSLTATLSINNIFNIRNQIAAYAVTGSPTDDGYLTDPATQSLIANYTDPQSYRDVRTIVLSNNNWNYSTPRIIRLELSYRF